MNELEWAKSVQELVSAKFKKSHPTLSIHQGTQLPYASEILLYKDKEAKHKNVSYQTDLLVIENINEETWKPRVVIETKVEASRNLEEMLYNSRKSNRKRYAVLHKPLRLE